MEKIERDTLISADENRKMFDRIANTYDVANRFISLGLDQGWRKKTIHELNPKEDEYYLDIGTGTGDLAFELLSQSPKSQVDAIDPSEKMLAVARDKALSLGVSKRPRFQNADALNLPMPECFFDGIVSGFCFRNGSGRVMAHVDTVSTYTTSALRVMVSGTINAQVVGLSVVNPTYVFIQIWGDT